MSTECDVVVLGMGTCGEDASLRLARAGLEVVGVEGSLIGGECPFWACLPTKSMVRSANLLTEARRSDGLVGSVTAEPSWELIAKRIRAEVTGGWDDSGGVTRFEALGGRFARGRGEVVGPGTVSVAGDTFHARVGVVVATGSTPVVPPIPGLAETPFWTNHEAVAAEELPGSLAILGGGAVGCEIGQVYARFGSRVTIVEGSERVLAAAEPEASRIVHLAMEEEGVGILT
ncbi:MAG TPA: FAD-dependent oxidoreductase, partial [Acidimicrobiia bacterium]